MNGQAPGDNWTALFNPDETVRLRFINGGAQSTFDVRIPGLDMQVVMVDGKAVKPVDIHEFRISVAETYDVLVRPKQDEPFTIFAESLDRSGYARGTLSPAEGLEAPVPNLRPRPVRTLEDIGMGGMLPGSEMKMDMDMKNEKGPRPFNPGRNVNTAMHVKMPKQRYMEPGIGLGSDGWNVLTYKDLISDEPQQYPAEVDREMTINITANMERFMFSFDGMKYSEHPGPYLFRHNERLRLWLVNHTMMDHPIHLHGMWMQIENGQPHDKLPYKHTVLVKPGEKIPMLITPIEKGDWAFHCHLLYHMEAGMFQVMRVA
jgi:FtsP/CotA-like multicopper oxidase with cupredoxin domain